MRGVVAQIIADRQQEYETLNSFQDRMEFLVTILNEEGFMARWAREAEDRYVITEHSCPYINVGSRHDEICTFDNELMMTVLQTDVVKESCMLQGDSCCQFTVKVPAEQMSVR